MLWITDIKIDYFVIEGDIVALYCAYSTLLNGVLELKEQMGSESAIIGTVSSGADALSVDTRYEESSRFEPMFWVVCHCRSNQTLHFEFLSVDVAGAGSGRVMVASL